MIFDGEDLLLLIIGMYDILRPAMGVDVAILDPEDTIGEKQNI